MQSRFWKKVAKSDEDKCWIWNGATNPKGYGLLGRGSRGMGNEVAHRYSYMIHVGEIPSGMLVCHQCDNRACVNPSHLFLGTPKQNSEDMVNKRRHYMTVDPSKIRRGFKMPKGSIVRGMNQKAAKLTDAIIPLIRDSLLPQRVLAKQYNVSQATITRVKSRKIWSHIP